MWIGACESVYIIVENYVGLFRGAQLIPATKNRLGFTRATSVIDTANNQSSASVMKKLSSRSNIKLFLPYMAGPMSHLTRDTLPASCE